MQIKNAVLFRPSTSLHHSLFGRELQEDPCWPATPPSPDAHRQGAFPSDGADVEIGMEIPPEPPVESAPQSALNPEPLKRSKRDDDSAQSDGNLQTDLDSDCEAPSNSEPDSLLIGTSFQRHEKVAQRFFTTALPGDVSAFDTFIRTNTDFSAQPWRASRMQRAFELTTQRQRSHTQAEARKQVLCVYRSRRRSAPGPGPEVLNTCTVADLASFEGLSLSMASFTSCRSLHWLSRICIVGPHSVFPAGQSLESRRRREGTVLK